MRTDKISKQKLVLKLASCFSFLIFLWNVDDVHLTMICWWKLELALDVLNVEYTNDVVIYVAYVVFYNSDHF